MAVKPKISIITASKNGGRFLRQTLDSISQQSFTDYEHIVADSASTDNTLEILQEYQRNGYNVRWISEPDRHTDEGFYKAMKMARGEYIMLICISDGYLDRNWFQSCIEILDNDPEVSLVHGALQSMTEDGLLLKVPVYNSHAHPRPQKMDFLSFWLGTFCLYSEITWCVRADVFKKCFSQYETSGYFLQNHAMFSFNYNFNVNGYLPYFLPTFASFGRSHHDSNSKRIGKFNSLMKKQYRSAIIKYGNQLLFGKRKHVFRDGKSNVIKTLEPHELKLNHKKILHYRINRKAYKGKRRTGGLYYWRNKLRILILYLLSGGRIYR